LLYPDPEKSCKVGRQESIAFPYDKNWLKYAHTYHIIREHVLSLGF